MHECSTATESLLCCVFLFYLPRSGGERSGVEPHCTSHSAAPQVWAGHCPCGGQHLWVLQWSLNLPISSSCCQLPFSHLRGYLGMSVTGVIRLKCYYSSSKLLPGWKATEQRIQTCLLSIIHLQSIPPFLWGCQEIFPNINPWNRRSSDWTLLSFRGNVWELRDGGFGMSLQLLGPTVRPGGNLNALNPFLKGTSQWCTVL